MDATSVPPPAARYCPPVPPALIPPLVFGWTTANRPDGRAAAHAVEPFWSPAMPPRSGGTLCGKYAHLDHSWRHFDPAENDAGPLCPACSALSRTLQGPRPTAAAGDRDGGWPSERRSA
jgi:hypothetical protein